MSEHDAAGSLDLRSTNDLERDGGLGRLDAFSDGVFAIAITVLVLEIHLPTVPHGLANELLAQWPMYVAYVASFIIIGIWWANHHELFEHFAQSDHMLMLLNTLHLMWIAFVPFATAVLAEYVQRDPIDAKVAAGLYSGSLLLAGISYNLIWNYAVRAGLVRAGLSDAYVQKRQRQGIVSVAVYVLAVILAAVNVWLSLTLCFLIALYFALPSRRTASSPTQK